MNKKFKTNKAFRDRFILIKNYYKFYPNYSNHNFFNKNSNNKTRLNTAKYIKYNDKI